MNKPNRPRTHSLTTYNPHSEYVEIEGRHGIYHDTADRQDRIVRLLSRKPQGMKFAELHAALNRQNRKGKFSVNDLQGMLHRLMDNENIGRVSGYYSVTENQLKRWNKG